MIDWWGPIIHEYYAGTEGNGFCFIDSRGVAGPQGLGRPAAASASVHICDEDGERAAGRARGHRVLRAAAAPFEYHNDPDKTRRVAQRPGTAGPRWATSGYVDEDGYLYLTDRKAS